MVVNKLCSWLCVLILFGLVERRFVVGLYEGDACVVERNNSPGICRLLTACPEVAALISRRQKPTKCGFQGFRQIVCCPIQKPSVVEVTTDRISTHIDDNPTYSQKPASTNNIVNMRISEKKCHEYKSAVYQTVQKRAYRGNYVEQKEPVCNMDKTTYVINGEESKPGEFPHMALLGYNNGGTLQWACGGSLISERYILTAAHCLRTVFGPPTRVALGVHSIDGIQQPSSANHYRDPNERSQVFGVEDIAIHREYNRVIANYNDIGLIRLDRPVAFTPYIRPACLPSVTDDLTGLESGVACGWGHTEFHGTGSQTLMKVKLDLYTAHECNQSYTKPHYKKMPYGANAQTQLCAGSRTDHKDTCQGDSGGPLQTRHADKELYCMYSLLGITSAGRGCGGVNSPSVYTRVRAFVPWIESIVWLTGSN